jgi:hypothetical protein
MKWPFPKLNILLISAIPAFYAGDDEIAQGRGVITAPD